jgi:predicted nucleotidyltransferase
VIFKEEEMARAGTTKKSLKPPVTRLLINSIVKRLTSNLNVEKIILFGSYASGTPTKDSDIDIFVIVNTKEKGIRRYALVSELLEPREIPLDIIVKTPAEVKRRSKLFDPLLTDIYKTGKILYEKKN